MALISKNFMDATSLQAGSQSETSVSAGLDGKPWKTMENHGKPWKTMENPALCLVPGSLAETGRPTRPSTLKVAPGLAGIRRIEGCLQTVDTFLRCSAQAAQMQNHTGLPSLPLHGRVELHYSTIPYFSNGRLHLSQHLIEFCLTKDPYGPRHSTILSDIIRLCLKFSAWESGAGCAEPTALPRFLACAPLRRPRSPSDQRRFAARNT